MYNSHVNERCMSDTMKIETLLWDAWADLQPYILWAVS